jgi:carboxyl-terminal processing protease
VNAASYATIDDYFAALKTRATTASGKKKDQFSFTLPTLDWERQSQTGVSAGYGVQWAILAAKPPRRIVAGYLDPPGDPTTPAAVAGIARGAEVLSVDGTAVVDGDRDPLNNGLFFLAPGDTHTLVLQDRGAAAPRTVQLTAASLTSAPVQAVQRLPNAPDVGYMLFNDHLATAEAALVSAVQQLQGVSDLVVDIRYNGGGFLDIASELAFMIAGPSRTAGKTFERTVFNDKYPTTDPVQHQPLIPELFLATTRGYSLADGQRLPTLNLGRVFVLTGPGTCSASESVINSLRGVDVQVIQIGATTCGKPYGFYPQDNCGTTFFAIEFKGANAKGFGDYADGFTPGGTGDASPPGCLVADDFGHALGDPAEARLAAALQFRASGTCPAASALAAGAALSVAPDAGLLVPKPAWLQNRIVSR